MDEHRFSSMRRKLLDNLEGRREIRDEDIYQNIDDLILESGMEYYIRLADKTDLRQELFNSVRRLDILQELIDDDSVTEIMVNGTDGIYVERGGRLTLWDKCFYTRERLEDIAQQIVGKCNRIVNESVPIVDARLENGARVNIVMPPVALNGPVITIRRFPDQPVLMDQLIRWGTVT